MLDSKFSGHYIYIFLPGMYSTVVAVSSEASVASEEGENKCRDGEFIILVLGGSAGGACWFLFGIIGDCGSSTLGGG